MAKFKIQLCREVYQYGTVFIEAETEQAAREEVEEDLDEAWLNATIDDEVYAGDTTVQDVEPCKYGENDASDKTTMLTFDSMIQIYGCDIAELDSLIYETSFNSYTPENVVTSILSDAQHLMEHGDLDTARQRINRAKYIIVKGGELPPMTGKEFA